MTKPAGQGQQGQEPSSDGRTGAGGSAWATVKTIAWAFFGVRRRNDHEREVRVNPLHVVAAGFVGVFVLVAALIVLVKWVAA
ncbi:MAG: DUF2970 domain-containing protein [Burkholderiaceae bacterium]